MIRNPILPGFSPDPSIVRVGEAPGDSGFHGHHDRHGLRCSYRRNAVAHFNYFDLQHGCDLHLD